MNIRKYLNNQNWNIGFTETTPSQLIQSKRLSGVKWMKHPYKDRFFADPFILKVDDNYIYVLAEELIFGKKGTIVLLKVKRGTYNLIERKTILKLETHLSYPHIVKCGESIYVIPENSESGKLSAYQFDSDMEALNPVGVIADEPLIDATLLGYRDVHYLIATKLPDSLKDAYLYKYDSSDKKFKKNNSDPVIIGLSSSRMGGAFFVVDDNIYRPAQDCEHGYGKALTIFQVDSFEPTYKEHKLFRLEPCSWKYNLGLHTLNFDRASGLAVIDSYGYLYPVLGRVFMTLYRIKHHITKD